MAGSPNHELVMEEATVSLQDSLVPLLASKKGLWAQTGSI